MKDLDRERKIAEDFPGLKLKLDGNKIIYLDSAASSLKPKAMVDAMNEYYLGISSNVHRGNSFSLGMASNRYEETRYKVAELISCASNEVVFLKNTTEAINTVARGLALDKHDKVVICSDSHHSNMLPWMEVASPLVVNLNQQGDLDLDHYRQLLKTQPKVVALTHCSNVTGIYCPLKEMIKEAKEVGSIVIVDAAQSVPHRRINVRDLDADFVAFSAHKMLGPTGLGVLFGKIDRLEQLQPSVLGGGMADWVRTDEYILRKVPHRFEAGTPNIGGVYGLGKAVDYLTEIGFDYIEAHDKHMGQRLFAKAMERDYLEILNTNKDADRGGIVSLKIPKVSNMGDLASTLSDNRGIMCRNGYLCAQPYVHEVADSAVLRVSTYIYNSDQDVDYFFDCLDELVAFMA